LGSSGGGLPDSPGIPQRGMPGFVVNPCRSTPGTDHRFVTQ
jgi:hypothetical protein